MPEFYHGTSIEDGLSILDDGLIFSRSFWLIKKKLAETGWAEDKIRTFLRGLRSVLPLTRNQRYDLRQVRKEVRRLFSGQSIEDLVIETPITKRKFLACELVTDTSNGIVYFSDYVAAVGAIISKCSGEEGLTLNPEGVVFGCDFPSDESFGGRDFRFSGLVEVSDMDRQYILSNDQGAIDKLRSKAHPYGLNVEIRGASLGEDSFGASQSYIRSLEIARQFQTIGILFRRT